MYLQEARVPKLAHEHRVVSNELSACRGHHPSARAVRAQPSKALRETAAAKRFVWGDIRQSLASEGTL